MTVRQGLPGRFALLGEGTGALGLIGVAHIDTNSFAPARQASVNPSSKACHKARFVAAMAAGEFRAMVSASRWASSRNRSGGSTTWLTIPSPIARWAEMRSYRPTRAMRITASAGISRNSPIASIATT